MQLTGQPRYGNSGLSVSGRSSDGKASPQDLPGATKAPEMSLVLGGLPPFPALAMRVLRLVSNPSTRLHEVHELIRADQAFSSELLRIANSPLYGIRTEITSTLQATMLLGFDRVKALVLTLGMKTYFGPFLQVPALRACWRHSLACAVLAEELAIAGFQQAYSNDRPGTNPEGNTAGGQDCSSPPLDKDFAYTAGILHDVGRVALAMLYPQPYAEFLKSTEEEPCDHLRREQELFRIDHCQAGQALALAWKFPRELVEVMAQHHSPRQGNTLSALSAVQIACMMAEAIGFGAGRSVNSPSYEELLRQLPECGRQHFCSHPEEFTLRIAGKIDALDSA
jgi:HD-like signal output (HDOD) protein